MYKKMTFLIVLLCFGINSFAQYHSPFRWNFPKSGGNNYFGSSTDSRGNIRIYGDGSVVKRINRAQSTSYLLHYLQGHTEKSRFLSLNQYYLWTNYDYSFSTFYSFSVNGENYEVTTHNTPMSSFSLSQNNVVGVGDQKVIIIHRTTGEIVNTIHGPDPSNSNNHFTANFHDITTLPNNRSVIIGSNSTVYTTDDYSHYNQSSVNTAKDAEILEISHAFDTVPKRKMPQDVPLFAIGNQWGYSTGIVLRSMDNGATWDSVFAVPNVTLRAVSSGSITNSIIAGNTYNSGVLYYTKDGGDTWAEGGESSNYIYSITHVSADSAYAVGAKGLILLTTDGGEHWAQISDDNPGFYGIYFSSPSVGYAVSIKSQNILSVYKTTDAGENWNEVYIDSSFSESSWADVGSIFFIDDMTGFIAGSKFLRTTDGGATWNEMDTGITSDAIFQDVYFVDSNLGFAVYRDPFNGDGAIKTTNGGSTWNPLNINNDKYDKGYIYFTDANLGFISGYSTLYRTTDGGDSWDTLAVGTNSQDLNSKVTFINSTTGFFGKKGQVFKTTDRGETWTDAQIDNHSIPQEIQFVSDSVGYLVCTTDTFGIPVHVIFKTVDGGNSWADLTDRLPGTTGFQHLFFTDQTTGYLAGSAGIIKTTTGGEAPTAIEQPGNPSIPSSFTLEQNYPNPFNPVTTIQYSLPRDVDVRLVVYDISGRQVKTLVNQKQGEGRYSVQWNGTNASGQNVSSGVYFYQIITGSKVQTHKMILLR